MEKKLCKYTNRTKRAGWRKPLDCVNAVDVSGRKITQEVIDLLRLLKIYDQLLEFLETLEFRFFNAHTI